MKWVPLFLFLSAIGIADSGSEERSNNSGISRRPCSDPEDIQNLLRAALVVRYHRRSVERPRRRYQHKSIPKAQKRFIASTILKKISKRIGAKIRILTTTCLACLTSER